MRIIKFRGKRIDNGEWITGNLTDNLFGEPLIEYRVEPRGQLGIKGQERAKVIPETVGQATGHKIKDVELFEGDIVRVEEDAEGNDPEDVMNWYVVTWVKEWCMFALLHTQNEYFQYLKDGKAELDEPLFWTFPLEEHKDEEHKYFLCGNSFDNPELLINK